MGNYAQIGLGSCRSSGWGNSCLMLHSWDWASAQKLAPRLRVRTLQRSGLERLVNTKGKGNIVSRTAILGFSGPQGLRTLASLFLSLRDCKVSRKLVFYTISPLTSSENPPHPVACHPLRGYLNWSFKVVTKIITSQCQGEEQQSQQREPVPRKP